MLCVSNKGRQIKLLYLILCDPRTGHFCPKEHILNKIGTGPLDDDSFRISRALGLVVSDKKIFKVFISKIYFSLCDLECNGPKALEQLLKKAI